jgi:transposase InsO family protein
MSGNSSPRQCESGIAAVGAKTAFIEPGSPLQNGYRKSFNSKLRDELLNSEIFYSLAEAGSSSRHGGAATKPGVRTLRSHTNRRRQPSPGLQNQPGRFGQQRKQ